MCLLVCGLQQTKAFLPAGTAKELSHLLRGKKHNKSHLWLHRFIRNLSLNFQATAGSSRTRTEGAGTRELQITALSGTSITAAVSTKPGSQRAPAGLQSQCQRCIDLLSQSSRKVVEEQGLVARQFPSYLQSLYMYFCSILYIFFIHQND